VSDRELKFTDGWVETNSAYRRLQDKGYHASGWIDKGVPKYALYRNEGRGNYVMLHEFNTPEELNNMVKLLLDE
jgi:hypothetical protein